MSWFTKNKDKKLEQLRRKLFVVRAEIAAEEIIFKRTGKFYPIVQRELSREEAGILFDIMELEKGKKEYE